MHEPLEIHGDGSQSRSFIYIDDLVGGLVSLGAGVAEDGVFNLCSDPAHEISIMDLAKLSWQLVNGDEPIMLKTVPYSAFGNYEDVPRRTGSSEKASRVFGFKARTLLRDGMKKTITWQRKAMGV